METKLEIYQARFIDWLKVKGYHERTIADHKCYVRQFINYLTDEMSVMDIQDIDNQVVFGYQSYLYHSNGVKGKKGKRLSLESQSKKLHTVKRLFDFLQEIDVVLFNPAANLKLPQLKKKLPKGILSEQQMETLLNQADVSSPLGFRDRTMMEVLYASAIRNSELRHLAVYDVDVQQMKLTVRNGKGSKDRVVPLGEIACDYVKEYVQTIRSKLIQDNTKQDLMFVSKHGKKITRANLVWIIHKYVKKAGNMPKNVGPHSFRHSCATHMLRHGADIRYVQQLLGHASVATTQIYTHLDDQDLKNVHRRCHPRERFGEDNEN